MKLTALFWAKLQNGNGSRHAWLAENDSFVTACRIGGDGPVDAAYWYNKPTMNACARCCKKIGIEVPKLVIATRPIVTAMAQQPMVVHA